MARGIGCPFGDISPRLDELFVRSGEQPPRFDELNVCSGELPCHFGELWPRFDELTTVGRQGCSRHIARICFWKLIQVSDIAIVFICRYFRLQARRLYFWHRVLCVWRRARMPAYLLAPTVNGSCLEQDPCGRAQMKPRHLKLT